MARMRRRGGGGGGKSEVQGGEGRGGREGGREEGVVQIECGPPRNKPTRSNNYNGATGRNIAAGGARAAQAQRSSRRSRHKGDND